MPYNVLLDSSAAKVLKKLDDQTKTGIKQSLGELADDTYAVGEPLYPSDYWKIRTGDCRALYEISRENQEVIVLFVWHSKNVYIDFSKVLQTLASASKMKKLFLLF